LAVPPDRAVGEPATTKKTSAASVMLTMAMFVTFDRRMPDSTTPVSTRTAPRAAGTSSPSASTPNAPRRYPEKPRAAVAADMLLAIRNIHPAVKPSDGVRYS
jgi:hypothetical protein